MRHHPRVFPYCQDCRDRDTTIAELRRIIETLKDRRISERIRRDAARRQKPAHKPGWLESLRVALQAVAEALKHIPQRNHGWSCPGSQDLSAIANAAEQIAQWETLIDACRKEFLSGLGKQLARLYPGNLISDALIQNDRSVLLNLQEELSENPTKGA